MINLLLKFFICIGQVKIRTPLIVEQIVMKCRSIKISNLPAPRQSHPKMMYVLWTNHKLTGLKVRKRYLKYWHLTMTTFHSSHSFEYTSPTSPFTTFLFFIFSIQIFLRFGSCSVGLVALWKAHYLWIKEAHSCLSYDAKWLGPGPAYKPGQGFENIGPHWGIMSPNSTLSLGLLDLDLHLLHLIRPETWDWLDLESSPNMMIKINPHVLQPKF